MSRIPTEKQQLMIEEKIKGKKLKEIAAIAYPDTPIAAGMVQVSSQLHKSHVAQYMEQRKLAALKKYNVNWERIIKPISEALDASKMIVHGSKSEEAWVDEVPDHMVRLAASRQARELLPKLIEPTDNTADIIGLTEAINTSVDDIELTKVVFKKGI